MSTHLLGQLVTMDVRGISVLMYIVLDDARIEDTFSAANDDEALAKARALFSDGIVDCEPALSAVAARRRADVRELTLREKIAKAHTALPILEASFRDVKNHEAYSDLLHTASVFAHAVASDTRRQWYVAATVRGMIGSTSVDRDVVLLVVPGARPALAVLSRADAASLFAEETSVTQVDRLMVEIGDGPADLVRLLTDAYVLTAIPRVTIVESGRPRTSDSLSFELLAGCLAAISRFVEAKVPGVFYDPLLGGRLDIKLATFQP